MLAQDRADDLASDVPTEMSWLFLGVGGVGGAPRGPENLCLLLLLGWWSWSKTKSGGDPSAHLCLATLAPSFCLSSHPGRGVVPPGNTRGLPPLRSKRFGSMGPRRSRDSHMRFPVREQEGHGGVPLTPHQPHPHQPPATPRPGRVRQAQGRQERADLCGLGQLARPPPAGSLSAGSNR